MEEKVKKGYKLGKDIVFQIESNLEKSECKTASEFVEKAIAFYVGYLNCNRDSTYLTPALESVMKATIQNSEDRIARVIYKMAVEQAMMMHLFAAELNYNMEDLNPLRGRCIQELNKTHGKYTLEDATDFQRSSR